MAVVTIEELINQRELIDERKKQLYELETSVGTILVQQPTAVLIAEADRMKDSQASNAYIVIECTVSPNLKDPKLLKAFGALEPLDVVTKVFKYGEVFKIAEKLTELAGFKDNLAHKIHEKVEK